MLKLRKMITKLAIYLRKPRILIITHRDTDGVACASMLIRYIKHKLREDKFMTIFSGPTSLPRILESLKIKNARIFICDISPNISEEEKILRAILRLKSGGNNIEWIDHHEWRREFKDKISSEVSKIIVDKAPSTARLIFQEYMHDDEVSLKIMKFGDDADTLSDNFKETIAYRILLFTNSKWRKYLMNKFVQGIFWDKEIEETFKKHLLKIDLIIQKIIDKSKILETKSGKKFTIINLRGINYPKSWIAGKVAEKLNVDFTVVIRKMNAISLYCRKNSKVNLLPIALHYGGGGHAFACGFRIKLSFKSLILSLILGKEYIPEEIWEVVEKVKNKI